MRELLPILRGRLVAAAALLVLNVALFVGALQPAMQAASVRQAAQAGADARAQAAAVARKAQADLETTRRQAEAFAASFPSRTGLLALTGRLQGAARALDLKVPTMDYRPDLGAAAGAPLERVGVSMRVEGPYAALRRFIHEVEGLPRAVVIEAVTLRGRPGEGVVQLALELSAYSRLTVGTVTGAPSGESARPGPLALAAPAEVSAFEARLVDLPRPAYPPVRRDLFAVRRGAVPRAARTPGPAVAIAIPTPVPAVAPVAAPPAPDPFADGAKGLRLVGTAAGKDGLRAFVGAGTEVLVVKRGDRVGGQYVVKDIHPEQVVLRSPEGDREVTLSLKEAPRHAP